MSYIHTTVYRDGQCLDKLPGPHTRKTTYFSHLDSIREQRACPPELKTSPGNSRTGNYSKTNRSCPCNKQPFRSYAEMIRCVNKQRGPCDKCA